MLNQKTTIITDDNISVQATSPVIISASRSTDIPAFYCDWFFNRFKRGYSIWVNPFNNQKSYISYENVRFIVFWSKNPKKLIDYADFLKERNINCYIQYTLNDYEAECLEPNIHDNIDARIDTFKRLVDVFGENHVIWRFDPLILTDEITIDSLINKIDSLSKRLYGYTDKLVFSFCDIAHYPKVKNNLEHYKVNYSEWSSSEMCDFAQKLSVLNKKYHFKLATCAEKIDLSEYGILHNHCIDDEQIVRIAYNDNVLMDYLGIEIKTKQVTLFDDYVLPENAIDINDKFYAIRTKSNRDSGQRQLCGCITSKDIGQYNTCIHGCKYCYANTNNDIALTNYNRHIYNPKCESIV